MKKLAVVIKYFPTSLRYSGVTSMCEVLVASLCREYELSIYSACDEDTACAWNRRGAGTLHAVSGPGFWWSVGSEVAKSGPQATLVISGIHKSRLLFPVLMPLLRQVSRLGPVSLLQAVNVDRPGGFFSRCLYRSADHLLASNPQLANQFNSSAGKTASYLPPCINVSRIENCQAASRQKQYRVGFINHINPVKGADLAVGAFARAGRPDTEFLIAGEGELKCELQERYRDIPAMVFTGKLDDPISEIKACDIMVLPFRTSVSVLGVSQTVLECMAAGAVVIGSDETTITSVIKNGKTGIIVKHADDIPEQIHRLLDDAVLRATLAQNAAQAVRQHDAEAVSKQLQRIIG